MVKKVKEEMKMKVMIEKVVEVVLEIVKKNKKKMEEKVYKVIRMCVVYLLWWLIQISVQQKRLVDDVFREVICDSEVFCKFSVVQIFFMDFYVIQIGVRVLNCDKIDDILF